MSFEARVYIQGVAVYVPDEKEPTSRMRVLFPNQARASEMGIRDSEGTSICQHHAVVQFDARCLASEAERPLLGDPDSWKTIELSGKLLRFETDSTVKPTLSIDGRVPGVPYLPDVIRDHIPVTAVGGGAPSPPLDLSILPQASLGGTDFLKAGLTLDAGVLSPYAEFEGLYTFPGSSQHRAGRPARSAGWSPHPEDHKLSSVLKLELGQVSRFTLHLEPFGTGTERRYDLSPPSDPDGTPWDELEVWVRHFCELDRPDPDGMSAEPEEKDVDFALNYMLLKHLDEVLRAVDNILPVPSISSSWGRGGLIGSKARKCMGTQV